MPPLPSGQRSPKGPCQDSCSHPHLHSATNPCPQAASPPPYNSHPLTPPPKVNAVRWDPAGKLLASCSDDATAKVWQATRDAPVHSLTAHVKEVYTLKWSPSGPSSPNPGLPLQLATASFDGTAKVWDAASGDCVATLQHYSDPGRGKAGDHSVYSVAWAPSARLLATGSIDGAVRIWSVPDGSLVRTFKAAGGVFEVCWDKAGARLAVSTNAKVAHVLELRY